MCVVCVCKLVPHRTSQDRRLKTETGEATRLLAALRSVKAHRLSLSVCLEPEWERKRRHWFPVDGESENAGREAKELEFERENQEEESGQRKAGKRE